MEKQELLSKIDEMEKQIEELKNQVNSIEFERIKKPEYGERYYYLSDEGVVTSTNWYGIESDIFRFNTGNCFKTEQEAEDYKENLLTKQALKHLALELNNGVEIDWKNEEQPKFYIYYNYDRNLLCLHWFYVVQTQDVFCLNNDFLSIAKERIGEEKLIKLIK